MSEGQIPSCEVKVKISACPANLSWEAWESKAQGLEWADTLQKAALEAPTTFCGKHSASVAHTTTKAIPLHKQYHGHWAEHESLLSV
jgi:hypothetical protein